MHFHHLFLSLGAETSETFCSKLEFEFKPFLRPLEHHQNRSICLGKVQLQTYAVMVTVTMSSVKEVFTSKTN